MWARGLKQMRGSRVMLSPDSSADEGMRTRLNAGNPEARKIYPQIFTAIHR
jgi:hypothetical protein